MADENEKDLVDDAAEEVEETAGDALDEGKELASDAVDAAKDMGSAVADKAGESADAVSDAADKGKELAGSAVSGVAGAVDPEGNGDSGAALKWLLPLLLLGLLLVLGFMFCSKPATDVTPANTAEETEPTITNSNSAAPANEGPAINSGTETSEEPANSGETGNSNSEAPASNTGDPTV